MFDDLGGLEQDVVENVTGLRGNAIEGTAKLKGGVTEITLYALLGSPSPGTMKVLARIRQQEMVILIDCGSTHNFLDAAMWVALNLPLSSKVHLRFRLLMVPYSELKDTLKVQGHTFEVDLNI